MSVPCRRTELLTDLIADRNATCRGQRKDGKELVGGRGGGRVAGTRAWFDLTDLDLTLTLTCLT